MIDHSLVTGFTMFIRRSFDMTCFGISTYHRHEPPLAQPSERRKRLGHRGVEMMKRKKKKSMKRMNMVMMMILGATTRTRGSELPPIMPSSMSGS